MRPTRRRTLMLLAGACCAASEAGATVLRRDRTGRVLADVALNGQGPFHFVVDTGANRTVLAPQVAAALGLAVDRAQQRRFLGVGGAAHAPMVRIDSLETGALQRRNVDALVMAHAILTGADGMLGMDGLDGQRLAIDFERGAIDITAGGDAAPANFTAVQGALRYGRLLTVPISVGGVSAIGVIDTGSQVNVVNDGLLRRVRPRPAGLPRREVVGAGGVSEASAGFRLTDIVIGTLRLPELVASPGDLPPLADDVGASLPALWLGMDALGTARALALDLAKAELQVRANPQVLAWSARPPMA